MNCIDLEFNPLSPHDALKQNFTSLSPTTKDEDDNGEFRPGRVKAIMWSLICDVFFFREAEALKLTVLGECS